MSDRDASETLSTERYRRSGRIDLVRSAPWLFVLAVVTFSLSCLLAILFHVGGYLLVIVPIVAAFVLLIVMVPLVDRGQWRNPWAAALVGLLAGATAYLGYYYLDMIWQVGSVSETATRLDLLPEFISLRMQSDVSESVGSGIPVSHSPASPNAIVNWFTFSFELGLMALFPAVFGWLRSSRPFCESCGRWMDQSVVGYSPDAGPAIQSLAKVGDFERITSMPQMSLVQGHPATMLLVWHCDVSRDEPRACPVFLSVRR
ncbi:MAG: hypothetical protein KDA33_13330, partial [Phycisphaerales bacterium]|nr:hypothetical protein [Phycisphaerales bacterium]